MIHMIDIIFYKKKSFQELIKCPFMNTVEKKEKKINQKKCKMRRFAEICSIRVGYFGQSGYPNSIHVDVI